jgi:hypothetical protein
MKSKFTLTESERNRILGLHKSAIKKEFLIEQTQYIKDAAGKVSILQGPQVVPQGSTAITQQEYETALKTQNPPANQTTNQPANQPAAAPTAATPQTPQTPASNPNAPQDTKAFQDWLDKNKPGWTTGKPYKILEKKPERGYGKFGPLTQAAWGKYKNEFQPQQIPSSNTTLATSANPTTATPTTSGSTTGTTTGTTATTSSTAATTTNQVKLLDRVPTNKEIRQGFRRRKRVNNRMDRQKRKQLDDLYNQYEQIAGNIQKFGSRDDGSAEFKQQMATLENQVKNINAQIDKLEST